MSFYEVPIEQQTADACRTLHNGDWEQCEDCLKYFIWDKLPYENVLTAHESRGEFWGAPAYEEVVIGWICPECGHSHSL